MSSADSFVIAVPLGTADATQISCFRIVTSKKATSAPNQTSVIKAQVLNAHSDPVVDGVVAEETIDHPPSEMLDAGCVKHQLKKTFLLPL